MSDTGQVHWYLYLSTLSTALAVLVLVLNYFPTLLTYTCTHTCTDYEYLGYSKTKYCNLVGQLQVFKSLKFF